MMVSVGLCLLMALSTVSAGCIFQVDDDVSKPRGLEERALDSEVILAAYTRAVDNRTQSARYSAEFLVFNVIKGSEAVETVYQKTKPSALETSLNRRLVNVSDFGDPTKCEADVSTGETYILLLDVAENGELVARYDGAYGPAVVYSKDKETALEAIDTSPWGEWSPCSGSCGGGIQQRKRDCGASSCSPDEGQQRTCNMFPCTAVLNIVESAGVHRSSLHPSGRPSAYRLLPTGHWRSKEIVFPRTFPWEFSLLVTARIRKSATGGFLLRVLHSGSLQVGLYISDILTLVLSDRRNIRVSFIKSLFDDHWHQFAFSVRRDTVFFYLDCEYSGKLPLPAKVMPFGGQPATVVVGSTGDHELDAFQGDIEQITITGSPDAAAKQCNLTTQSLNERTGAYALQQEVRSRPLSTFGAQNDQLRGDLMHDDEDFGFEDPGSGDYDDYEETPPKDANKVPLKSENVDDDDENDEDEDEDDDKVGEDEDSDEDDEEKTDDIDKVTKSIPYRQTTSSSPELSTQKNIKTTLTGFYQLPATMTTTNTPPKDLTSENKSFAEVESSHVDEESDEEDVIEGSGVEQQIRLGWTEWSPCSSSCNWGRRSRTSYCLDNGADLEECAAASAKRSETEACFLKVCPMTTTTATIPIINASNAVVISSCRVRCRNGGTCQPPFRCLCPPHVYGNQCQYVKQTCRVTCKNGGTCQPPSTCVCPKSYFGNECQYAVCKPHCLNGGSCVAPNKCRCKSGYAGSHCHKPICAHGCRNGGECVAPNKCICRSGFTGKDCSQPSCDPSCQNGGECVKPHFCHCPPGTKGAFCEIIVCNPECRNGGLCTSKGKCSCPKGFFGFQCEQAYCPGGCYNGGKCGKTGKCICHVGYSGTRCEKKKPCTFVEVKQPYQRGYKQKVTTQAKIPCGAWGWKMCTKTKVHYETIYKTFYKTSYACEGEKKHAGYQKLG